jgi:hypothetical protein
LAMWQWPSCAGGGHWLPYSLPVKAASAPMARNFW